jgi:regulator of CtrA degradation
MQPAIAITDISDPVIFMPGIFNETLSLLLESHQYFEAYGEEEQLRLPEHFRLAYTGEMSRITMRLTSIMAWVMVRKAVHNGEIDENLACEQYRLDADEFCLKEIPQDVENLPFYIGELAHKTRDLYQRIWRLDALTYANQGDDYFPVNQHDTAQSPFANFPQITS